MSFINSETAVAHYTTLEVALEHILFNNKIRFSSLSELDDPRENKVRTTSGFDFIDSIKQPVELGAGFSIKLNKALDEYKTFLKVACFSSSKKVPEPFVFTKCYGLQNMWAQYGGNHKGVALIFDRDSLVSTISDLTNVDILQSGLIEYTDGPAFSNFGHIGDISRLKDKFSYDIDEFVRDHVVNQVAPIFMLKNSAWIKQEEFRILINDSTYQSSVDINIGDSLKAVVLGCDFHSVYESAFNEICAKNNLDLYKLEWDEGDDDFVISGNN